MIHVGLTARLVSGLGVDLALGLGLAPFAAGADAIDGDLNLLLQIGLGPRYTFGYQVVRPFVGARFLLRPNQVGQADLGAAGAGGIVILPYGPLRVQFELAGGWAGAPLLAACVGAGVAL